MTLTTCTCPICRGHAVVEAGLVGHDAKLACENCGRFRISAAAWSPVGSLETYGVLAPYLSAYVRRANEAGDAAPVIDEPGWRLLAEGHAHTPVSMKLRLLLEYLARLSRRPGTLLKPDITVPYQICDAFDVGEVGFLLDTLREHGDIEKDSAGIRLRAQGWARLDPVSGGVPGTCFIAMSYDPSLNTAFSEGIFAAVQHDCGFIANRVDHSPHNDNITDRIIAGIRAAQFVVADFTLQRPGVYYEAGFAQGLGRVVVRTCREDDIANLHFDTRQFFHLKWSQPADLRTSLADHVRATIGMFADGQLNHRSTIRS